MIRPLLFLGWWSFPRAYVRRGSSSPRSQPGPNRSLSDFRDTYKDYLAGVRTPSDLEEPDFDPYWHFALPVLAIQSGGLVLDAFTDISRAIEHCVEDARAFYTLSFDPPYAAQPDEYHDLQYKSKCLDYLHARTPAITISRFSTISLRFPTKRVTVHELEQMLDTATLSTTASWQSNWRVSS